MLIFYSYVNVYQRVVQNCTPTNFKLRWRCLQFPMSCVRTARKFQHQLPHSDVHATYKVGNNNIIIHCIRDIPLLLGCYPATPTDRTSPSGSPTSSIGSWMSRGCRGMKWCILMHFAQLKWSWKLDNPWYPGSKTSEFHHCSIQPKRMLIMFTWP